MQNYPNQKIKDKPERKVSNLKLDDFLLVLGASEITANLYCYCVHLYLEVCVICSLYLR